MITQFKVQGFKSLHDIDLNLGTVNILIGSNGSGKSNLLEAIGVMGAGVYGSVEPETLRYRGVRLGPAESYKTSSKSTPSRRIIMNAKSENAKYYVSFENLLFSTKLRWQFEDEKLSEHSRQLLTRDLRECLLYGRGEAEQNIKISRDQSAAMLAVRIQEYGATEALDLLEKIENFAIFAPTTPVLRGISDDIARSPLGLGGSGLPSAVAALIDRVNGTFGPFDLDDVWNLIEWAEDMSLIPASEARISPSIKTSSEVLSFRDKFMRGERTTLSAYDASEGALYVIFMLALMGHHDSPKFVGIDNFDQALHPRLASALRGYPGITCCFFGYLNGFALARFGSIRLSMP